MTRSEQPRKTQNCPMSHAIAQGSPCGLFHFGVSTGDRPCGPFYTRMIVHLVVHLVVNLVVNLDAPLALKPSSTPAP